MSRESLEIRSPLILTFSRREKGPEARPRAPHAPLNSITAISGRTPTRTGSTVCPNPRLTNTGHTGPSTNPLAYFCPYLDGTIGVPSPGM